LNKKRPYSTEVLTMLAIRSRNDEVDEEERVPLTTYTDTSLFEGLSFPEVPKTSIRRNTNIADPLSYSTSYQYQSASQDDNDMEMIELADLPSAPLLSTSIQLEEYDITMPKEKQSASSVHIPDSKVPTVKGSLSTLYASAEIISSESEATSNKNYYPEVPSLSVGSISEDSTIPLHERISATSTLIPLVSASYNQPHVQQRTTPATQSAATSQESFSQSNLVDELLQENSRLTQEVQHLRSLVAREQQTQSQLQNQQPTNYMAARSPITGTQVSDTTNPPAAGVKYVCCGACRQWLLAPTEVSYVVCSRCQAVNNCNLTPLNRVSRLFNFLRLA
jgi:hypothetical protein